MDKIRLEREQLDEEHAKRWPDPVREGDERRRRIEIRHESRLFPGGATREPSR